MEMPDSSETFIHQSPSGEFVKTKNTYLLDMWEGFEGRRIPVSDSAAKVFTFAVLDGDLIRLVINNSTGRRVSLDVEALLPAEGKVASVKRRTVVFAQGETRYLNDRLPGLKAVPLRVDETCILEIALDREPVPETRINEVAYYAPQTAVTLGDSAAFDIQIPDARAAGAMLRVGLHRSGGFSMPVAVTFNGEKHSVDLGWSSGIPHFLDFIEIPVRPEHLNMLTRVTVRAEEPDATVTAIKLVLSVEEKSEPGGRQ